MINFFFNYFNQISVLFLIITFFTIWIKNYVAQRKESGKEKELDKIIGVSLASATIPTSFALILCAFDDSLIDRLAGLNLNLAVAGIVLFYVAFKTIKQDW